MIKMLSLKDFKLVKFEDKKIFDDWFEKYPQDHSDYLFSTIISWMDYANYHYTLYKNSLIIYTKINDEISIRPPIGKRNKDIFDEIINIAKKSNSTFPVSAIDLKTKNWILNNYPKLECVPQRDFFDYVYLSSDLAELDGSKYSKIRNRLNKFKRQYDYETELISDDNVKDVKEFLKRWCIWKDCESDPLLEHEKNAVMFSMDNFFELGLNGIVIRINNKIEAMSAFEKMNSNIAVIHYEKASPDYEEIYKAINNELAKNLSKNFVYINRESDMGINGLRKAKLSYKPHHMVELFDITKENLI
jgi:hypothetical protein